MPKSDEWLSAQTAADRLGITVRTLYAMLNDGEITGFQIGRRKMIRLKEADVAASLEKAKIVPGDLDHLTPDSPDGSDTTDTDASGK